jgi:2-polyprenyl-3-methyl-5-hydroxy-6-metoxy-1,4-benzoquinol methylase
MKKTEQIETILKYYDQYKNASHGLESMSGLGSCTDTTEDIRRELPLIFEKYEIKSFIDAPCGDFFWMKMINLDNINYTGYDVVDELINTNNDKFGKDNIKFELKDVINTKLKKADLILCRDFFFHISNDNVDKVIKNIKRSGITYMLATYFDYSNSNTDISADDKGVGFRKINIEIDPFSLGEPIYKFYENNPKNEGRCLGLWKIN